MKKRTVPKAAVTSILARLEDVRKDVYHIEQEFPQRDHRVPEVKVAVTTEGGYTPGFRGRPSGIYITVGPYGSKKVFREPKNGFDLQAIRAEIQRQYDEAIARDESWDRERTARERGQDILDSLSEVYPKVVRSTRHDHNGALFTAAPATRGRDGKLSFTVHATLSEDQLRELVGKIATWG